MPAIGSVSRCRSLGWIQAVASYPPATGRHAEHVVDVAVGHQDADRLEPVLLDHAGDALGGLHAGVDDHALGAGSRRHDVAVGAPRTCGEAGDQHRSTLAVGEVTAPHRLRPESDHLTEVDYHAAVMSQGSVHEWGRVDEDGNVFVRTADGERPVGQYPAGTPDEALAFFTERFEALAFEVELLEQRIRSGVMSPEEALESVKTVSAQVTDANAVGDLASLTARLEALRPGDRGAARVPAGRAGAEDRRGQGGQGEAGRRGREDRRGQRLAGRRQPAAHPARRVEGAPPHRPRLRRRAVAPVLGRADVVHPAPQGALRRAEREARRRPRASRSGWSRRPSRSPTRPSGARPRAATAT